MAEIEANNVMDGQSVSNPGSLADVTPTGEQALDSLIETMRRGLSGDPSGTDPLISYDKEVTEEFSRWANLLENDAVEYEKQFDRYVQPPLVVLYNSYTREPTDPKNVIKFLRIALSHIKDRELIHLCFIKTLQKRHERAETERDEKGSFNQEYSQVYMDFWLLVAKTLLHEHRKELISQEYGSEELEKLGPLHLSAGRGDHEIVSEIIETINSLPTTSFSTGFKEQALLSKDDSEKTALVLAIKSLSVKCVQHLLTSCKGLASEAHGSDYKYPLYDLIISVLRKPKLIQDACSILEALVLADPKNTLTAPRSQNGGLKGKTPLVLLQENLDSLRARKKNRNGPVQRISNQINSLAVLQTRMERLAYDNLRGSELQLALHGTSGCKSTSTLLSNMSLRVNQGSLLTLLDKLTHLILSDFNIVDPEKQKEELAQFVQTFTKHDGLEFHEALALVQLPDLSKADPVVSMGAIQTLFKNLKVEHKVKKIVKLIIRRDHPTQPTHDWYISALVRDFEIEILDWQKADFDLHYLANPPKDGMPNKPVFLRDLHLYSSGHEGPLYSWTGKDGLIQLPFLKKAEISLLAKEVALTQSWMQGLSESDFENNIAELKERVKDRFDETKSAVHDCKLEIAINFKAGLFGSMESYSVNAYLQPLETRFFLPFRQAQGYLYNRRSKDGKNPLVAKVAIIDNGIGLGQEKVSRQVVAGKSFVEHHDGWVVPWFTAQDPHGTEMASLVTQVNPFCDLYIYRINVLRDDIRMDTAVQAITEAINAGVDIISLSWAFQKSSFELQEVLERAATSANGKDPILVFCSKSDESFSGNVFPADLDTTISVAAALSNATGSFGGHVSKPPDIVLYGQDMPVGGLQYARNQKNVATGSSVATALASGMASLLLGLARAEGQGERGADPKQKRHLQLVGKESGASESDEDEVGTAKTSSVKNAIFVSSLKRRENMLDILRSFKTDRSNVIPFVDPNIMFKNTSRKGPPVDLLRTAHEVVRRNNQQQGR